MHSHGFNAYLGRAPSQSMISVIRNTSQMHAVNHCAINNDPGRDGFHQSHCTHEAHVCVCLICCGLLWSGNVCGFDLVPTILSPYVTPYSFSNNCDIFSMMCKPVKYHFSQTLSVDHSETKFGFIICFSWPLWHNP